MALSILIVTVCVSILSLYISITARLTTQVDRYVRGLLCNLTLHSVHIWIVHTYFADRLQLGYYAPYGLLYGPFLYFMHRVAYNRQVHPRLVPFHLLPFLVFTICYFLLLVFPAGFERYQQLFGMVSSFLLALSNGLYAILILFFAPAGDGKRQDEACRMISMMGILVCFVAVVFLVFMYAGVLSGQVMRLFVEIVVSLIRLGAGLILFSYMVKRLVQTASVNRRATDLLGTIPPPAVGKKKVAPLSLTQYQKSAVSPAMLQEYESALRRWLTEGEGYLDHDLSLESLAKQLKIPKHHLSQVFSRRIGQHFNTCINAYRIKHAVALMHSHPDKTISDIFLSSGFAAKGSFNRYFKQFHGCTPTEYRSALVTA
ncbi:helix-turn-helix domain-containing protein [Parapedobacter sp. DT-150]|uniref:AraC family transcriptional regulator n=1 Tax=Parapedobacter sp. DT-150 TaxID=3396162 RepID=UPI003F1B7EB7